MSYQDGIVKQTEFFTTAELAQKLKMNVQVVTRKVQSGEIRAYKIGKEWRIPELAVFEWLEGRTNRPNGTEHEQMLSLNQQSGPFHQSVSSSVNQNSTFKSSTIDGMRSDQMGRTISEKMMSEIASVSIPNPVVQNRPEQLPSGKHLKVNGKGASSNGGTRRFLLEYILAQFEPHRSYQEQEIDLIIRRHGQDPDVVKSEMMSARMLSATHGKFTRRLDYQLASGS